MRCEIVAELGCTHEGRFETCLRLIDAAAAAGATTWKAQWVSDPLRMCIRRKAQAYLPFYEWLAFPLEWHGQFAAACVARGLRYACSVYLPEDAAIVAPYVSFLKISSFENADTAMIEAALATPAPVVISLGQSHSRPFVTTPAHQRPIRYLHCTSAYPAPVAEMHVSALARCDGLSDHSRHVLTGAVAVGAGATMLEVHYRLEDCDPQNPDYPVAFTPAELRTYVAHVRLAEQLMGDPDRSWETQPSERWALAYRVT